MYVIVCIEPDGRAPGVYGPYQTEEWAKRDKVVIETTSQDYPSGPRFLNVFVCKVRNI